MGVLIYVNINKSIMAKKSGVSLTTLLKGIVIALLIVKLFHLESNTERFTAVTASEVWALVAYVGAYVGGSLLVGWLGYQAGKYLDRGDALRKERMKQVNETAQRLEEGRIAERVERELAQARAERKLATPLANPRSHIANNPPKLGTVTPQNSVADLPFGKKNKRTRKR